MCVRACICMYMDIVSHMCYMHVHASTYESMYVYGEHQWVLNGYTLALLNVCLHMSLCSAVCIHLYCFCALLVALELSSQGS